jgi:hypothetical protein
MITRLYDCGSVECPCGGGQWDLAPKHCASLPRKPNFNNNHTSLSMPGYEQNWLICGDSQFNQIIICLLTAISTILVVSIWSEAQIASRFATMSQKNSVNSTSSLEMPLITDEVATNDASVISNGSGDSSSDKYV